MKRLKMTSCRTAAMSFAAVLAAGLASAAVYVKPLAECEERKATDGRGWETAFTTIEAALAAAADRNEPIKSVAPEKPYGFVSVSAGDGLAALFTDLGADVVVSGGQTMNPSTDDILRAVEATPAETVFVLPNNKNIIMAAEQAIRLATRKIIVIHTRTIPQGVTAMLSYDPEASDNDNAISMGNAINNVATGQITFAARDSEFDGKKINKGDLLALENGRKMLEASCNLSLCSSGPYPNEQWAKFSARPLSEIARLVSQHFYAQFPHAKYTGFAELEEAYYTTVSEFRTMQAHIHKMRSMIDSSIRISFDEWNVWYAWYRPSSVTDGIFNALRHFDLI